MRLNLSKLLQSPEVKKMEVKKITVDGFRNIKKTTICFDSIITALVSLNGYGKSNVLDAIDFGFDFISTAKKEKMMTLKQSIPILKSNVGKNFFFEIELEVGDSEYNYCIDYGFSFTWKTENSPGEINQEFLRIKKDGKNQRYGTYILRNKLNAKIRTSEAGRCNKSIKIEDNGLVVNKILALDDLYYHEIIKHLNSMEFFVERHLDPSSSFAPDPFIIKGFDELELQVIQSIPRAIFFLKKDYSDKYELLVNAFKQLFPHFSQLSVNEIKLASDLQVKFSSDLPIAFTDNIYSMSIVDDRLLQPMQFEQLSDGTKRIFLMLTFAVIADIKNLSVIAIEEPENSIHPSLCQGYLDILSQLVSNCKILITSHSPYIIQYLEPHSIYIGMPNSTGEADFKRIALSKVKHLLNDAAEYEDSMGNYIFNLLSSSDSLEYLEEYIERNGEDE